VALVMTEADLAHPTARIPTLQPRWHWLAWITRVGTQVVPSPERVRNHTALLPLGWQTPAAAYPAKAVTTLNPYALDDAQLLGLLQARRIGADGPTADPGARFFRSETGEVTIDGPRDVLVLDTPRTAGGYAPAGLSVEAPRGGVRIVVEGSDATAWVSSLDKNPIHRSQRLLVSHLTDLQNTEIRYAEPARQTLQDWGRLPYLVRSGKATVSIRLDRPARYRVWALTPGGRRVAEVPARVEAGALVFAADVAADPATGARMLYEVALR
jgi:hypothetical protein